MRALCAVRLHRPASRTALLLAVAVAIASALSSAPAQAFEAFEGRLQAHGFFESQMRSVSADYSEDWDVVQWWQIFNLELEADLFDGKFGPLDVASAYVRMEVRYDCVYSRGCGMFRSMNMIGDRAKSLPRRLDDAHTNTYAGAIEITDDDGRISGDNTDPVPFRKVEGFRTLDGQTGPDGFLGDPRRESLNIPGSLCQGRNMVFCQSVAGGSLDKKVNRNDDPFPYVFERWDDFRFTHTQQRGGSENGLSVRRLGPWLPENFIGANAGLADRVHPFDSTRQSPVLLAATYNTNLSAAVNAIAADPTNPTANEMAAARRSAYSGNAGLNITGAKFSAGSGARPFTPIPVRREGRYLEGDGKARGIYIPSLSVRKAVEDSALDDFTKGLNFRESERAWNRGQSQQQTKELKEAYLDLELFDTRLFLRVGRQTIVWGKTELFRTTDQFNPQDIALASLPSLEESRIPLWAIRGIYSFYEVGPLDDVRLEVAMNYDKFQPSDFGACGEAFTVDLVCQGSFGALAHSATGLGLAGMKYPDRPWDDIKGWEGGARVEFRWDRYSFAISDFYGYNDFPWIERLTTFERNVDPKSGRPRYMGSRDKCREGTDSGCLLPGPSVARKKSADKNDINADKQKKNKKFRQRDAWQNVPQAAFQEEGNALFTHPGNLQIFAMICSTTVGVTNFDPTACAQNSFGSQAKPIGTFSIAQTIGTALAGGAFGASFITIGYDTERLPRGLPTFANTPSVQKAVADGLLPAPIIPFVALDAGSKDLRNGRVVTFRQQNGKTVRRYRQCKDLVFDGTKKDCGGSATGTGIFEAQGVALAQQLSKQQEAALGCGPFFGTNCDDSGIDLLNMDGSALLQAFPGYEGSEFFTNAKGKVRPGKFWRTDNASIAQPGTKGFRTGPICGGLATLGANDKTGRKRLSGCRLRRVNGKPNPFWNPRKDGRASRAGRHPFTGQKFATELAALSWNMLMITISQDDEFINNPNPLSKPRKKRCSLITPQFCPNVQGLFRLGGISRPDVKAGGNVDYGRRAFQWSGGGDLRIRFDKSNVLGFAADWAADSMKANFSAEITWFEGLHRSNSEQIDGVIKTNEFNLAISADRPTFINFLNMNRTFFFNTQWFVQYVEGWEFGTSGNGPWNFLATFAAQTGYYQDRLLPSLVFVYDFKSVSGGVLPQVTYRYNEAFSVTIGANIFMGRQQLGEASVNELATQTRAGPNQFKNAEENGLAVFRNRDEVFLRVRYTF